MWTHTLSRSAGHPSALCARVSHSVSLLGGPQWPVSLASARWPNLWNSRPTFFLSLHGPAPLPLTRSATASWGLMVGIVLPPRVRLNRIREFLRGGRKAVPTPDRVSLALVDKRRPNPPVISYQAGRCHHRFGEGRRDSQGAPKLVGKEKPPPHLSSRRRHRWGTREGCGIFPAYGDFTRSDFRAWEPRSLAELLAGAIGVPRIRRTLGLGFIGAQSTV
jgi:hypothetical protein